LLLKEDVNKSTDGTLLSNSDVKYPTVKATKTYVDSAIVNGLDVSVTEKGKIKLAGDIGERLIYPLLLMMQLQQKNKGCKCYTKKNCIS
jgi:hypothetical protein